MTGNENGVVWPSPGAAGAARAGQAGQAGQRLRGPRWIVSIRALVVVLAMLAAALGVLWLEAASVQGVSADLPDRPGVHITVPPLASQAAATSAHTDGTDAGKSATGGILVHVVGAVNNPGVFALPQGSRVYQAVESAGGALATAQLAALNMAAPASDGMQIVVLTRDEAAQLQRVPGPGTPGTGPAARNAAPGPVNINAATAADLDALPGIGPVLAERIVAWRADHGPYPSVDALDAVSGIGAKLLENIRGLVSVS